MCLESYTRTSGGGGVFFCFAGNGGLVSQQLACQVASGELHY